MKNQVTNGFDRMTVANLLIKANFILSEIAANVAYFPQPEPQLSVVQTALDDLQTAALAAENRDRVAVAYRNEKQGELVVLLRKLGVYVNLAAAENETIALSSGFSISKERQPAPAISYVEVPVLKSGVNSGEIQCVIPQVKGARVYQHLISVDDHLPLSQWQSYPTTKRKFQFTGLQPATRYYVRTAAIGVNNQVVYSEPASLIAQ